MILAVPLHRPRLFRIVHTIMADCTLFEHCHLNREGQNRSYPKFSGQTTGVIAVARASHLIVFTRGH